MKLKYLFLLITLLSCKTNNALKKISTQERYDYISTLSISY